MASSSSTSTTSAPSTSTTTDFTHLSSSRLLKHIRFFSYQLLDLPSSYQTLDPSRLTLLYFVLSSLDVTKLGISMIESKQPNIKKQIIQFVERCQIKRNKKEEEEEEEKLQEERRMNGEVLMGKENYEKRYGKEGENCELIAPAAARCGFRGSAYIGVPFASSTDQDHFKSFQLDEGSLAMTYSALAVLHITAPKEKKSEEEEQSDASSSSTTTASPSISSSPLLSPINLSALYPFLSPSSIISSLPYLQQPDGSFTPTYRGGESDLRFLFCACAISCFLRNWRGVNIDSACKYVLKCQSYDGGFGLKPEQEGHGGSTYCAVAALKLMGKLNLLNGGRRRRLIKWCVNSQCEKTTEEEKQEERKDREEEQKRNKSSDEGNGNKIEDSICSGSGDWRGGFHGRPNKPCDTCYSFWIASVLHMLNLSHFISPTAIELNRSFTDECETSRGGFGKEVNCSPDLLHSYYGLCGLSLMGEPSLNSLAVHVGLTTRAWSGS